jgi:hypothetical protein
LFLKLEKCKKSSTKPSFKPWIPTEKDKKEDLGMQLDKYKSCRFWMAEDSIFYRNPIHKLYVVHQIN